MCDDDQKGPATCQEQQQAGPIVQYIVVRTDLNWGQGAMIAQACHASVAAISQTIDSQPTRDYLSDLKSMHKVILKADKLEDLLGVEQKLKESKVAHHLWIEQPEGVASCLACSPQPKPLVQAIFRRLKLFR
jgi:peptidyl-tRNA hydrolase